MGNIIQQELIIILVIIINTVETSKKQKNLIIDLEFKEVKPVIIYSANETNSRLIHFSGEQSKGNIDWYRAKWEVNGDRNRWIRAEHYSLTNSQYYVIYKEICFRLSSVRSLK